MTQFDLLGSMVSDLDMAGIDNMVAGSFASTFRGEPRMTQDIDLVIDPDEDSLRRTITRAQRNALIVRDGGCFFPGCDRPPSWCDGHHVIHWLNHGPSELWNLTLLCPPPRRARRRLTVDPRRPKNPRDGPARVHRPHRPPHATRPTSRQTPTTTSPPGSGR